MSLPVGRRGSVLVTAAIVVGGGVVVTCVVVLGVAGAVVVGAVVVGPFVIAPFFVVVTFVQTLFPLLVEHRVAAVAEFTEAEPAPTSTLIVSMQMKRLFR
jgi:hypothetical protein